MKFDDEKLLNYNNFKLNYINHHVEDASRENNVVVKREEEEEEEGWTLTGVNCFHHRCGAML